MRRKYGGYNGRKRLGGGKVAVLTLLFWAVSGIIMLSFIHGGPEAMIEAKGEDVAKMYIGSIFPSVSRSAEFESREAMADPPTQAPGTARSVLDDPKSKNLLKSMMGSMFPGAEVLDDDLAEEDPGIVFDTETDGTGAADGSDPAQGAEDGKNADDVVAPSTANVDDSKPLVIIYHTHATESYQPVSEGNFHSLNEYGTVREVGDVLTAELTKMGIQVIHDKTIHDSPSYNQSYTRSLETIQTLLGSHKSATVVIDLHRDAAAYRGNESETVSIKKDTAASYSLVVGTGNPNVESLKQFAGLVNKTAEELYPGFGGHIIEKKYKFNQYVSDHHLLLEVGNNQNNIDEAKVTGKYFAHVLAKVIQEME